MTNRSLAFDSVRSRADAAAAWLARHDRGLSAHEKRELAAWQAADPRNAEEYARLCVEWKNFDVAKADADLLAMADLLDGRTRARSPRRHVAVWFSLLAAAAGIVIIAAIGWKNMVSKTDAARPTAVATYQVVPSSARQLTLDDGSVVSLRDESEIQTDFTPSERRVRLVRGEAHFAVAKNPNRPFIVSAGGVSVRAVGTAFNVRMDPAAVEVLVTEGKVRVNDANRSESILPAIATEQPPVLSAGQRVLIDVATLRVVDSSAGVNEVTPAEIERALAWQSTRLVFNRTPLADAIEAFNRHENREHRLVLGDDALRGRLLGGTFRADNVDGFVRLLELSADVRAEQRADGTIVLWPSR